MNRKLVLLVVSILLLLVEPTRADDFDLPLPNEGNPPILVLWATQYYVHAAPASTSDGAIPLVASDGTHLGVSLSARDWCDAAVEGTVTVNLPNGTRRTFNVDGMAATAFADCTGWYSSLDLKTKKRLGRMQFFQVPEDAPFGVGARPRYRLVPFRSIAVDRTIIPLGTVLFIPELRGKPITLPDGRTKNHDGYVMAVDTGGGIKDNHIDVFTGVFRGNPFPDLVRSRQEGTFEAFVVTDVAAIEKLRTLHLRN